LEKGRKMPRGQMIGYEQPEEAARESEAALSAVAAAAQRSSTTMRDSDERVARAPPLI